MSRNNKCTVVYVYRRGYAAPIKQGISNPQRTKNDYIFLNKEDNLHRYRYSYFCKLLIDIGHDTRKASGKGGRWLNTDCPRVEQEKQARRLNKMKGKSYACTCKTNEWV